MTLFGCSPVQEAELTVRSREQASTPILSLPAYTMNFPQAAGNAGIALAATDWLSIGDRAVVDVATGVAAVANTGSGDLSIGTDAKVGPVWSQGKLLLGHRTRVDGAARYAGSLAVGSNVVVTGGLSQGTLAPLVTVTIPSIDFVTNAPSVMLEPDQTSTLPPGTYGTVSVKSRAKLKLASGQYKFLKLYLEPDAVLELDSLCSSVDLAIAEDLLFRGKVVNAAGQGGTGLAVTFYGTNTAHIESSFTGSIAAPRAEVILNSREHRGRFLAKRLRIQSDAIIRSQSQQLFAATCQAPPTPVTPSCQDGLCCKEDSTAVAIAGTCRTVSSASCVYGSAAADIVAAADWTYPAADALGLFTGAGADVVAATGRPVLAALGAGNDTLCGGSSAQPSYVTGGAGDDVISIPVGEAYVHPGAGADKVTLGPDGSVILIADLCEVTAGDVLTSSAPLSVIQSAVPREALLAAGLTLVGEFDVQVNPKLACYASCESHAGCPISGFCGVGVDGPETCSDKFEIATETPTRDGLYPAASPSTREKIFAYLDATTEGERKSAIAVLRQSRGIVRAAVLEELARHPAHAYLPWRRTQVELVAVLGGEGSVPLLRDWAKAATPYSDFEIPHSVSEMELHEMIAVEAAVGLARMAHAGMASAEAALEEVIQTENSGALDAAVVQYRALGETPERMLHLRSILPASKAHLADLTLVRLSETSGPQPPQQPTL